MSGLTSLGGIGTAAKGLFSIGTSFLGGAKYWLIAMAISTVAAGAVGYYKGSDHVLTKVINASDAQIASAHDAGVKAQADQDAEDAKKVKADYEARHAGDVARNASLEALLKNAKLAVPHQEACFVTPDAMSKLNDPDLIGKDAQ